MKHALFLAVLAVLTYVHFHGVGTSADAERSPVRAAPQTAPAAIVVAPAPSYAGRWKTGPNAQTDLKTGPNAQTNFEPFAPSEQASWNDTPGCTFVMKSR